MTFLKDLAERTVATYAQSFLGLLLADWTGAVDLGLFKAAALAAVPAALAVVKAALAKRYGNPDTASLAD